MEKFFLEKSLSQLPPNEALRVRYSFRMLATAIIFHAVQLPLAFFYTPPVYSLTYLAISIIVFLLPFAMAQWGHFHRFSLLFAILELALVYFSHLSVGCGYILTSTLMVQILILSYVFFVHGLKAGFFFLTATSFFNLLVFSLRNHPFLQILCHTLDLTQTEQELAPFILIPNLLLLGLIFALFFRLAREYHEELTRYSSYQKAIIDSGILFLAILKPNEEILLQDKRGAALMRFLTQKKTPKEKTISNLLPAPAGEIFKENFQKALTGQKVFFELEIGGKKGKPNYFEVSLVPVRSGGGEIHAVVAAASNITSLKEVQRKLDEERLQLKAIIDNIPHLVVSLNDNLEIVFMNEAFRKSFSRHGFPFSENVRDFVQLIPEAWRDLVRGKLYECLSGKSVYYEIHVPNTEAADSIYGINYHPIREEEIVKGIAIFAEEITQRRKYEEEILAARKAAEEANQTKSEFLANMSHEIRTPLNAISGYADLLLGKVQSEEEKFYLEKMHRAITHLKELVEDILELSLLEQGKSKTHEAPILLHPFFEQIRDFYAQEALRKGLRLNLSLATDLPPVIMCDFRALRQILLNLLSNAVKFTSQGYVEIRVSKASEQGERFLQIEVSDSGCGIEKELQGKIFERFRQGDSSYTKEFAGTGVGLALTRKLLEKIGGWISVQSEPGQGSTFKVTIPYQQTTMPIPEAKATPESPPSRPKTILIAEDNEDNLLLMERFLTNTPHRIIKAHNGLESLKLFQEENVDLVLMDMQMPLMDGFEATREIRRLEKDLGRPHTPVAAITAYATPREINLLLESGCDTYLIKPFRKEEFLQLIAKLISQTS
ncbi:MAG: ATP-binding protein [Leptospiraceae bacterium]|nr:ATP-binding protein [Leptospiraceae bacterium]MDW8306677.1 ATP-binding protein [Leptospiraceae bacterium]